MYKYNVGLVNLVHKANIIKPVAQIQHPFYFVFCHIQSIFSPFVRHVSQSLARAADCEPIIDILKQTCQEEISRRAAGGHKPAN